MWSALVALVALLLVASSAGPVTASQAQLLAGHLAEDGAAGLEASLSLLDGRRVEKMQRVLGVYAYDLMVRFPRVVSGVVLGFCRDEASGRRQGATTNERHKRSAFPCTLLSVRSGLLAHELHESHAHCVLGFALARDVSGCIRETHMLYLSWL